MFKCFVALSVGLYSLVAVSITSKTLRSTRTCVGCPKASRVSSHYAPICCAIDTHVRCLVPLRWSADERETLLVGTDALRTAKNDRAGM